MELQIELATPRLLLKSITPGIIHRVFTTESKENIMTYFSVDENGYDHYHSMHKNGMETHRLSMFFFLLVKTETGTTIGECGFHTWNKTHRRAELFYTLRNDSDKNRGYMRETLPVVLNYGFDQLGLHRIEALVAKWNAPSIKLLLNNQFTFEGTMREDYVTSGQSQDSDCYSLLRNEWKKDHASI